jgi:L-gulonate 5-dehydrogenase
VGHPASSLSDHALDRGAEVTVVDKLENRLELATRLGASFVTDVTRASVEGAVFGGTGGDGPTIVVDATGVPALIRLAADVVAPSCTVVVVGISLKDVALSVVDFTRKELNVLGSRNNAGLFADAV